MAEEESLRGLESGSEHTPRINDYSWKAGEHGSAPVIYNPPVRNVIRKLVSYGALALLGAAGVTAQEAQPKIQVNFLNSCHPSPGDVDEMKRALEQAKARPAFAADFEISRGRSTLSEAEARAAGVSSAPGGVRSEWVRVRREFAEKAALESVQYSVSQEGGEASEVLAVHLRQSKTQEGDVLQVLLSNSVSGRAARLVEVNTPPDRIRIERYGKSSIVLTRCGGVDQSAYEPVFSSAAEIFEQYRAAMAVKKTVPAELIRLPGARESKASGGNH
jgi:hypothetical protein